MPILLPPSTAPVPSEDLSQVAYVIARQVGDSRQPSLRFDGANDVTDSQPTIKVRPFSEYAKADIRFLSDIVAQICDLSTTSDEEERINISVALWSTQTLSDCAIIAATQYQNKAIPYATVSPDSRGGLRIEWVGQASGVRLIVPPETSKAYIYHEQGNEYAIEPASSALLARWLRVIG